MTMRLNDMKPAMGSRKTRLRVGRGASAGQGKTCGRGVKGQRARKGGYHKVGFEGGQMPLQRRLPKVGFRSKMFTAEVRLDELAKVEGTAVDIEALKKANVIPTSIDFRGFDDLRRHAAIASADPGGPPPGSPVLRTTPHTRVGRSAARDACSTPSRMAFQRAVRPQPLDA